MDGYVSSQQFQFIDGLRVLPIRWMSLSCGCHFIDPEFQFAEEIEEMRAIDELGNTGEILRWRERVADDDTPFG